MMTDTHVFRRLVLGLQPRAPDHTIPFAIEFAELLNLDLLGVFLEDTSLQNLASIPFAREIRPLGGSWHPIDIEHLTRDLERAAVRAERSFVEAAKRLATDWRFEVARGPMARAVATVSRTNDIVMIGEPISAAERATQQYSWLMDAALQSAAAVLVVPGRVERAQGPVVAVARVPDDPSIGLAADIAAAASEELIILDICKNRIDPAHIDALAASKKLSVEHVLAEANNTAPPSLVEHLRPLHERLVVLTRDASDGHVASTIAAELNVPILVIEPDKAP